METPQSIDEVKKLVQEILIPIAFNIIPGGRTPIFDLDELAQVGVKYLSVPMVCLYPATKAMIEVLKALKSKDLEKVARLGVSWAEFNEIVSFKRWKELENRYSK